VDAVDFSTFHAYLKWLTNACRGIGQSDQFEAVPLAERYHWDEILWTVEAQNQLVHKIAASSFRDLRPYVSEPR